MFANVSLPDLAVASRRTVLSALIFGIIGLVACLALSAPLTGLGLCIGLGVGIFNFRLILRSVAKVGASEIENPKRPLAANTVGRLVVISVIAVGLLFISFDVGLGVMVGLAAFQFLLMLNVARSMFKMGSGDGDFASRHITTVEDGSGGSPT
jgi:hypothetical protein